jgi:hypothetical protein
MVYAYSALCSLSSKAHRIAHAIYFVYLFIPWQVRMVEFAQVKCMYDATALYFLSLCLMTYVTYWVV